MPTVIRALLIVTLTVVPTAHLHAQQGYEPSPANLEAREWFQDAKFGLFVHWGIYSVLGAGEWVMQTRPIQAAHYERLADQFNPTEFDAKAWVALVKAAGMRYITITSKHHDGFAMFDSSLTDWDIVDRTPYGRDVLAELAEACRAEGVKLFFYHSQLDWRHTDYYPRGRTGRDAARPEAGDWNTYIDFMNGQLRELLTNYGEIGGIWFDGMWDQPEAPWRIDETYALIHELQPQTLIGSNHHRLPFPGEDFQMFEKDLPGANTAGFNTTEIGALPIETAETINNSWGFNITDHAYKSRADLIRYLVGAAGRDANFLLNVGPMPNGRIQSEFEERLRAMGRWLEDYGESIYGTRGGPIAPGPWGVTTQNADTVFAHILDWDGRVLALPPIGREVVGARLVRTGEAIDVNVVDAALLLSLPPRPADLVDEVVALEIR
ncbi:MAG: alpha-L-fucosidase [Vicinamibacterales bacterium]|jgi:alpha-L-fucosidase|nr:alpha-L-fucosidase [Acidobacteriota bacterium]MDP7472420.1 alpha-L-fucosidase [Vicinamibacterales bacterium]MDP7670384.1 alpha-L-fucosidase [Vicinamibacterales bacterium]HJO38041.1 alpha-L-fucosidase [Vicinamibacterales bacterium]|tara:strand:+ start:3150 stop:4457 length:1308 start_codon:yes stop_codon:yes gene_type:complete